MADEIGATRGWSQALLGPVAEVNEQLLECLRAAAAVVHRDDGSLVMTLRADWQRLDDAALRRLAGCPYLLLDGGFGQSHRWTVLAAAVMDGPSGGYFKDQRGIAVVRQALLLGWHLARSNRLAARIMLGMPEAAAQQIANSRLRDLLALAECGPAWIVPRWERQPQVWQQLIHAACRNHPTLLRAVQLRGMQLLAGASTLPTER